MKDTKGDSVPMIMKNEVMLSSTPRLTLSIDKHRKGKKNESVSLGKPNLKMQQFSYI